MAKRNRFQGAGSVALSLEGQAGQHSGGQEAGGGGYSMQRGSKGTHGRGRLRSMCPEE